MNSYSRLELLVISVSVVATIKFYLNEVAYQTQIPSDITTQLVSTCVTPTEHDAADVLENLQMPDRKRERD